MMSPFGSTLRKERAALHGMEIACVHAFINTTAVFSTEGLLAERYAKNPALRFRQIGLRSSCALRCLNFFERIAAQSQRYGAKNDL
jgi:hypothetical protein